MTPIMSPASSLTVPQLLLTVLATALGSFALVIAVAVVRYNRRYRGLRLPPGPPGLPIVGNLLQVTFSGQHFMHYVRGLIKLYGPILTVRMGVRTLVVISSAELAHEALIAKSAAFASRPAENTTRNIFSSQKFTVNSAVYGAEWRALRRNMVSGMLSASRLREYRPARNRAMDRFIRRIAADASASADGATVWVLKNARFAVFCILLDITFGLLDLDEDHIVHIDTVMKTVLLTVGPRMDDYLPFLRPFFARAQSKALAVRRLQMETLVPLMDRRRALLRTAAAGEPLNPAIAAPFSYLDSLLDFHVDASAPAPTDDQLVSLCSEFINGGTDTTATAIEWAVARIIDNPVIQAKIHDEIAAVSAGARPINEDDLDSMPYLNAFVKELLRKHPPTYFSLTHAAVAPGAQLAGYDVPADANLEIFYPTISEDPKLWSRPNEFDPDRFLSGEETADITGTGGIRMIPFGAGRRICPGMAMGMTHIALMVARMVQAFDWRPHPSQPPLDFKDKFEFTVVMNRPLLAMIKPRKLAF